eukprot:GFUD01127998.1.p1 GENE.GFUD01127998.1~~GFUD01127998.1.p1  ORF type:complete len:983 (+),score=374.96 GFUD01127998.1:140-3088(+)
MGKDKRRRSSSLSPDRIREKKRRSRSREREYRRKEKKRSRSRKDRKRDRDSRTNDSHSRGNSQDPDTEGERGGENKKLDKDKEQARLELEMVRRRERIEKWRAEKKKKELETLLGKEDEEEIKAKEVKKWSLEEDESDEDEVDANGVNGEEGDGEVDPLDAYMSEVSREVRKIKGGLNLKNSKLGSVKTKGDVKSETINGDAPKKKGLVIMTGVAKKKPDTKTKKPEVMEQNQDALEYSSEEEKEGLDEINGKLKEKGKKDLVKIDHSGVEYLPFRKDFYFEVPELAKMSDAEVEEYRTEMEGIKMKGKNVPKPIKNWPQCGVSSKILHLLKKYNYDKPTPIQAQAIPVCMSGRDMIGIAKTGSGKTLAFLLPLFRHIADQEPLEEGDGPIAIIMTPTRELCLQIGKECRKFVKAIDARAVCVYGGTGISEQIAELKRGAEIIVCTPGRMIDMLAANSGKVTNLRRITYIVLDEADRMFDMGFEPQVMRVMDNCRPDRQTVMFSATFPRQMEGLARRILLKPVEVQVGGRSVVSNEIEQNVDVVEEDQKFLKLLEVLGRYVDLGSCLVFVDKQEHADGLLKDLMNASYTNCASLHGGIDQYDRDSTITAFKQGKVQILVATSVAARGLDVKNLVLVVNYDCPNHYEDYVHRVGRTGRAGKQGYSYTFITPEQDWYVGEIIKALELSESLVKQELRDLFTKYKVRMESEGKKVKSGGGFGGTGFKFDEAEAQYTTEKKKYQKAALGLQDSDDEDVEEEIDAQIEQLLSAKRTVKNIDSASAAAMLGPGATTVAGQDGAPVALDKLALAKQLASKINIKAVAGGKGQTQVATEAFLKGGEGAGQTHITAKSVADHLAAKLNARLNYTPSDEPMLVEDGGIFQKFEEELEINDFPQQARWKVTSKEALAQISEYSEAGITVRGTYYAPGKAVPDGERKLYLAIESTQELAVQKAKVEITRLLKEELLKLQTSAIQHINKGRYKVL